MEQEQFLFDFYTLIIHFFNIQENVDKIYTFFEENKINKEFIRYWNSYSM
jgi:hypothetical protein